MCQQRHLHVNTDLQQLEQVLDWFNQIDPIPMASVDWLQCQMALAEGFTNAVRHAHHGLPQETPIEIELAVDVNRIEIRIWDMGPPFDLSQQLASLPAQPQQMATEGRGLHLINRITDQLSYLRVDGHRNCLLMVKYTSGKP